MADAQSPDELTLWFAPNGQVGLDVRWAGHSGNTRAALTHDSLSSDGHAVTMVQDELGWRVRLGPLDRDSVRNIVSRFLARD